MFKIGLCQMKGSFDKRKSMEIAGRFVREAAGKGADVISLPEITSESTRSRMMERQSASCQSWRQSWGSIWLEDPYRNWTKGMFTIRPFLSTGREI